MKTMQKINQTRVKTLLEKKNAKLIDVRSPVDFANNTIPTAVNLPLRNISQLMGENRKRPLIFFGKDDNDSDMTQAENYATQMGFTNVYVLGAFSNWTMEV